MKFKNKTVLITGASSGIGKATALLFAKEGANVVVNYLNSTSKAEDVVNEIKDIGADAIAIKADVSNENDVQNLISKSLEQFGDIDVLVNNAGIVFDVPFQKRTLEQWNRTLAVDLTGSFLCAKYAVPHMKKQGKGRIINVSSTNAIDSFSPESMDYDCAKAGVILLTRNLAKELAPDILVNAVAPGWIDTPMNKDLPDDFVREETAKIYLKRFGEASEVAKAIVFLASDEASYITGTILKIDGGYG